MTFEKYKGHSIQVKKIASVYIDGKLLGNGEVSVNEAIRQAKNQIDHKDYNPDFWTK